MAEPAELRADLAGDGLGKRAYQNPDDPILPHTIIRAQNAPDVGYQRIADRCQKRSKDTGDRPIVVSKPLYEFTEDRSDRRIACLYCGLCAREVSLTCRHEIAVEACHVTDPCEFCASRPRGVNDCLAVDEDNQRPRVNAPALSRPAGANPAAVQIGHGRRPATRTTRLRCCVAILICIVLRAEQGTPHPGLHLDVLEPILYRWYPAQVVFDVLFADGAYRHLLPVTVGDCRAENSCTQEDAFAVMAECPVAEIGNVCLALVKPVMNFQIVFRHTAEKPRRADGMMIRVGQFVVLRATEPVIRALYKTQCACRNRGRITSSPFKPGEVRDA
jgi:hypothetical protein